MTVFARPGAPGPRCPFSPATTTSSAGSGCRRAAGSISRIRRRSPVRCSAKWPARPPSTSRRPSTPRTPRRRAGARPPPAERAVLLNKIADRIEENLERSRWPSRGTTASRSARPWPPTSRWRSTTSAISPAAIRAQEGSLFADRRGHRRLSLPRAARCRRPDHPVELPDPDGGLEAGPGAGRGQRGGAQAGRTDPGVDALPDLADR